MGLLDGGLARTFHAALSTLYLNATLHRRGEPVYADDGTITGGATDVPCKAQVDEATEAMRQAEGFAASDQRVIVLSASLDGPITTDDEITVEGRGRFGIAGVTRDPAGAYWDCRGRAVGG